MQLRELREPAEIARFLRSDPCLRVYELGDLDPAYFPHTRWWGLGDPIEALCLLWDASDPPTLLCFRRSDGDRAPERLLGALAPKLPRPFYAHLSRGLDECIAGSRAHRGLHLKLGLKQPERLVAIDTEPTEQLDPSRAAEMQALYATSYPGSFFDPRMLSSRFYFGAREAGVLVAIAGVHVVSKVQRVAALGNIVTDSHRRRRGYATRVTARLCKALLADVDQIGLNVKSDNLAALACYEKLGFSVIASYEELLFES